MGRMVRRYSNNIKLRPDPDPHIGRTIKNKINQVKVIKKPSDRGRNSIDFHKRGRGEANSPACNSPAKKRGRGRG